MSTCEGNLEGSTPPPEPPFLLAFRQSTSSCFRVSFISLARSPSQTCQVCNQKFNEESRPIQRVLLKLHAKTLYISNLVLLNSMGILVILSIRGGYKSWKPSKFVCNATWVFPLVQTVFNKEISFWDDLEPSQSLTKFRWCEVQKSSQFAYISITPHYSRNTDLNLRCNSHRPLKRNHFTVQRLHSDNGLTSFIKSNVVYSSKEFLQVWLDH